MCFMHKLKSDSAVCLFPTDIKQLFLKFIVNLLAFIQSLILSTSFAVCICRDLMLLWERCKFVSSANNVTSNLET